MKKIILDEAQNLLPCVWCTLLLFRIKEEMWASTARCAANQQRRASRLHNSGSLVHNYTDMDMWAYVSQVVVLTTLWITGKWTCHQVGGSQMMQLLLKLVTKMWFSACQHVWFHCICISLNCEWISWDLESNLSVDGITKMALNCFCCVELTFIIHDDIEWPLVSFLPEFDFKCWSFNFSKQIFLFLYVHEGHSGAVNVLFSVGSSHFTQK